MPRSRLLAAAAVLLLPAAALAQEYTVAPLAGGYVEPPEPVSAAVKNGRTEIIGARRDNVTVGVALPFPFPFFGTLHDRISVADDGWLAFGSTNVAAGENPELRRPEAPNGVVAPLWDSLRTGGRGSVVTFVRGAAPARTFVVAWWHVDTADDATRADLSFQVHLHEDTGAVDLVYADEGRWKGLSYTAGIENDSGTRAFGGPNASNLNDGEPASGQRFTPNTVTIRGTIRCEFPRQTAAGLVADAGNLLPVAGADVKLIREDQAGVVAATALTNALGEFTLLARGVDGAPTMAIDLFASGTESKVTDSAAAVYRRRIVEGVEPAGQAATIEVGPVDITAAVDATDTTFRRALAVQQAAQRGFAWVQAAAGAAADVTKAIPLVEIRWVAGSGAPSGYAPGSGTNAARITISDAPLNPDPFDMDVVLREYGQHVLNTIVAPPGPVTSHVFTRTVTPPAVPPAPQSEPVALADGFGWWFACAVLGRSQFWDTTSATATTAFDLEGPAPVATGANVAGAIAASLWDLSDPANESDDAFAGELPAAGYAVYAAIDQRDAKDALPAGTAASTIRTVFDAFTASRSFGESMAASRIFIHHQTLPDDTTAPNAFEPNDGLGEERAFPASTSKVDGLTLQPFNQDRFSFAVGDGVTSASVSFTDDAEVEVAIVDPSQVVDGDAIVIATASSTASAPSPVVVSTPAGLASGTYVVRISWKSGSTVHYTLALAKPPVLVTPALKEATAGTLYNFDLTVTGGIAPVTLALDPAVPGLAFAGHRLTGRPTTPGVYHVKVIATDASNSGPRVAGERVLVVNPALELVPTFAARRDRLFEADVGRGGTDATWTKAVAADPLGFEITGGSTLHVKRTTLAGTSFTLRASASDDANAVLPLTTCDIVLCDPLSAAARTSVDASTPFGYWFDAVAGSRFSATIRFAGEGDRPRFRSLLDDDGNALELPPGAVDAKGGGVRIGGVTLATTGRYFVVFEKLAGFAGTVASARFATRPPTRVAGVENVTAEEPAFEAKFTAIVGSHVRVVLRAGRVPNPATPPSSIALRRPGASEPESVTARPGPRGITSAEFDVTTTGEHGLTIGSGGGTTGPLAYEIVISPPKGAPFILD